MFCNNFLLVFLSYSNSQLHLYYYNFDYCLFCLRLLFEGLADGNWLAAKSGAMHPFSEEMSIFCLIVQKRRKNFKNNVPEK